MDLAELAVMEITLARSLQQAARWRDAVLRRRYTRTPSPKPAPRKWQGSRARRRESDHLRRQPTAGRRLARLRSKTEPAPEGFERCAEDGSRRCGWNPSRISGPAGMSARGRPRVSIGSLRA